MALVQINKLETFFKNKKITEERITRLTAPGENYGSLMLKVDITVENSREPAEDIYLVAKMVPSDERTREHFNTEQTFRSEVHFYKKIVPLLQNFQRENEVEDVVDFFPKYYGSRLNLLNNDYKVDTDAVLLLENLKMAKYLNLERTEGFDLDVTELVLTNLAQFHAVTLALRLRKNKVFEKKIRPYLPPSRIDEEFHNKTKNKLDKLIENCPDLVPLGKRILNAFDRKLVTYEPCEPFATVIHNDFWVNNVLIKFEGTKPIGSKMVDFQEYTYGSPAKDVIFFLFSSVKSDVLRDCYDNLVHLYFEDFVATLEQLSCDLTPYSFQAFEKELVFEARHSQFAHIIFMLYPIFAPRGNTTGVDGLLDVEPSEAHKKKLSFVIQEFIKRNWL